MIRSKDIGTESKDTGCCIVLTTTDDKNIADKIATELVQGNLAACVQIDETIGFFKWEGKFSQGKEYRLMIKTTSKNYNNVEELVLINHNYILPQIVKLDITAGLPQYLDWIKSL